MKKQILIFILSLFLLWGCGGSSSSDPTGLNGFWKGELLQTSLSCGGHFIAACSGCKQRDILLYVTGATDTVGSEIEVEDGECLLNGTQTEEGFEAIPAEGCSDSTKMMRFSMSEDGTAYVSISFDTNTEEVVGCIGTYGANLERD